LNFVGIVLLNGVKNNNTDRECNVDTRNNRNKDYIEGGMDETKNLIKSLMENVRESE
jgi:hypothetical protein